MSSQESLRNRFALFAQTHGRTLPTTDHVRLDHEFVEHCASVYEHAVHTPQHPATRQSYDAYITQLLDQCTPLERLIRMELATFPGDPYPSFDVMRADVERNQRLLIRSSAQDHLPNDHPLARPGIRPSTLLNDYFRFHHDLCHIATNSGFDLLGEEITAQLQATLCSAAALPALITETRLQTAWVITRYTNGHPLFPTQKAFAAPTSCLSYHHWYTHQNDSEAQQGAKT